ncbi:DUF4240 domain-containing protein [Streptomyces cellulosae]|uniref:DUF4240 domain-containing protein n=1 Tax=Streptomyces cellulosae TaxID=1968 RepID=A0ABW7YIA4_STRCE
MTQGRTTFEQVINDPDSLADLPAIQLAAAEGRDLDGEAILTIVWNAYQSATGNEPPRDTFTIRYPDLDPEWNFDFDDHERIAAVYPAWPIGQRSPPYRATITIYREAGQVRTSRKHLYVSLVGDACDVHDECCCTEGRRSGTRAPRPTHGRSWEPRDGIGPATATTYAPLAG